MILLVFLIMLLFAIAILYIEYCVCKTEKFVNVYICTLIISFLGDLLGGDAGSIISGGILSLGVFLIGNLIGAIITYFIYKLSRSFVSFVIFNFLWVVILALIGVMFGSFLLTLFSGFQNINLSIILLIFIGIVIIVTIAGILIYFVNKKKNDNVTEQIVYNDIKKDLSETPVLQQPTQVSQEPSITTKKGCPKCGRAVEGNLNNCPHCGYKFAELDVMYEKAMMEKDVRNNRIN